MSILVIHQGAIGDVVLSFPSLASLKQEKAVPVILACKDQVGKIARELRVVDAHIPIESARFSRLLSLEMATAAKEFISHFALVVLISFSRQMEDQIRENHDGQTCRITPRPPAEDHTHVAIHIAKQMQEKGLLRSRKGVESRIPTSRVQTVRQAESLKQKSLFVLHPGAGSQRKRWPLDRFIELSGAIRDMNSAQTAFLIGPAESDLLPLVKSGAQGRFRVFQVEDLSKATSFIRTSRCFVGNDSGLAHLAGFMGVPTVAIFGPSSPERWSPIGYTTKALRSDVDCAPCFEVERQNCEDPECLSRVSVDMVLDAVRGIMII